MKAKNVPPWQLIPRNLLGVYRPKKLAVWMFSFPYFPDKMYECYYAELDLLPQYFPQCLRPFAVTMLMSDPDSKAYLNSRVQDLGFLKEPERPLFYFLLESKTPLELRKVLMAIGDFVPSSISTLWEMKLLLKEGEAKVVDVWVPLVLESDIVPTHCNPPQMFLTIEAHYNLFNDEGARKLNWELEIVHENNRRLSAGLKAIIRRGKNWTDWRESVVECTAHVHPEGFADGDRNDCLRCQRKIIPSFDEIIGKDEG